MIQNIKAALRTLLTKPSEIVTTENDPNLLNLLDVLPNPDPILLKIGKDQEVYGSIMYDAHVLGELRSVRAGLLGYEWRLMAGAEDPASMQAFELIKARMESRPAPNLRWDDFTWNCYQAVLRGQSVHEVGWEFDGQYLWPTLIKDRPNRRFAYSLDQELRYLTRTSPIFGESAPDHRRFLITRHMHSADNPYGVAVLSACFWPHTFKHSGWKWLVKLGEKYGLPWAIGRYAQGSDTKTQRELEDALRRMVEAAVAAVPEGTAVELIERQGGGGDSVQERIINVANREMSKALTSQTLSTEIQGSGSRAASETHREREQGVSKSDRDMISETYNQLLAWITELNFPNAKPPYHEFYEEDDPGTAWAEMFDKARHYMDIPAQFAYERLKINPPEKGQILLRAGAVEPINPLPRVDHAKFRRGGTLDFSQTEPDGLAVDNMLKPVEKLLAEAQDLAAFERGLNELLPDMDEASFADYMTLAITHGVLTGMDSAGAGDGH